MSTHYPPHHVRYLCIHYSATPVERVTSYEEIERGHLVRGFREFGYHFWFPRGGGCRAGRDVLADGSFEIGAHSKGENGIAIGLCYEGGVHEGRPNVGFDSRTDWQISELIGAIDRLLSIYGGDGVDPATGPVVIGHRDMPGAATQCPGFDAGAWWREVQAKRAHRLGAAPASGFLSRLVTAIVAAFRR